VTAAFAGPDSLRVRGERTTFVLTLCSLPLTIVVLGWVFQHQITWQELALIGVVAMVYVAFARGRLLGGGLRIHTGQLAHVHATVDACARMLRMPAPHVFVRDDPFVPVVAIGIGDPYAIVISAQYVEHFRDDELRFLIGRELGHIASGHTRFTSLLSSNGRENGVIAVAFGAWLRRIDYTADRVGLLCCGSLDAAMRAIAVSAFHSLGRKIDLGAFAGQLKELHAEPSLRLAEWTASTPYATNRIAALHRFARDPLYLRWAQRFRENAEAPVVTEAVETVYAGFWRRAWAFAIDVMVIQTMLPAVKAVRGQITPSQAAAVKAAADDSQTPRWVAAMLHDGGIAAPHVAIGYDPGGAIFWLAFFVYGVVLVALVGQTFGMMVSDLRVVGANREARVGLGRALGRYLSLILSMFAIFGWFSVFRRVQPYEKMSRTRLVSGSAAVRS
jgi:Zn-dependent protease with chaperone function